MRRRLAWEVILTWVGLGCSGVNPELSSGGDDGGVAGGDATVMPRGPGDDSGREASRDAPNEALDGPVGKPSDAGTAADGNAGDARGEAGTTCTPGGACNLGPCVTGQVACQDRGRVCLSAGTLANGTPCSLAGGGGDSGAGVCSAGACTACASGADCSPAGSCQKRTIDCSSGQSVCSPAGNATDGTTCGDGGTAMYCSGGVCSTCKVGAACALANAPCHVGQVSACTNGVATCRDTGTSSPNGQSCGMNAVCSDGACSACTANLTCTPAANPCHLGLTSCSTGASVCQDTGRNQTNGTTCPHSNLCYQASTCQGGACTPSNPVACTALDACHVAGTCNPTTGQCSNPAANNGTACDDGDACTQTDQCSSGVCMGSNPVTCTATGCQAGGTCDSTTGACKYTAGACPAPTGCQSAATCHPATGACTYSSNPSACTQPIGCQTGGSCDSTTGNCSPLAGDPCQTPPLTGPCIVAQGSCMGGLCNYTAPDGTACSSGNLCVTTETCTAGACGGGVAVSCDSGLCSPTTGCI